MTDNIFKKKNMKDDGVEFDCDLIGKFLVSRNWLKEKFNVDDTKINEGKIGELTGDELIYIALDDVTGSNLRPKNEYVHTVINGLAALQTLINKESGLQATIVENPFVNYDNPNKWLYEILLDHAMYSTNINRKEAEIIITSFQAGMNKQKSKPLEVKTSAGIIRAYADDNVDQPSISVVLKPKDSDDEIDCAFVYTVENIEYQTTDKELSSDVVIQSYGNPYDDAYTKKDILRRRDVKDALQIDEIEDEIDKIEGDYEI